MERRAAGEGRESDNINESVRTREIRIRRLRESEGDTESQTAT